MHTLLAEQLPARAALFARPDLLDVSISPDGRQLAFLALEAGRTNLWLAPLEHPARARPLIREPGRSVFAYTWAGKRLVYQSGRHLTYWTDNRDGDDYVIYMLDSGDGSSHALTPALDRRVRFASSPQRPDEIFVSPSSRLTGEQHALRIDLRSGAVQRLPAWPGLSPIYADQRLEPRLAVRAATVGGIDLLVRADRDEWRLQRTFDFAERLAFTVYGFDRRGRQAFVTHAGQHDAGALFAIDLASGRETLLAHRDGEEIDSVLMSQQGRPIAYESGRLRNAWTVLDDHHRADFAKLSERAASLAVPESDLEILGSDGRDRLWLVAFEADAMPRRYYTYDRRSGAIKFLFSESRARGAISYAATRPVVITARDGLELVGYLTLPGAPPAASALRPAHPEPLVLWVHGGPQSRETWRFDARAQWLASRGYAVLNLNYRGSAGFGKRFVEAGYGEWGARMQDDLIDAVRWAVRERIADPQRVALMGLSYGGYATLSALAGAPELFQCGVETVGLSDLNLFLDTLAAAGSKLTDPSMKRDFDERMVRDRMQLGGDERTAEGRAALAARSPLTHAARIRVPLLITHGLRDDGVVPAHSARMVEALERNGAPVTYLAFPDEGHGLALPQNNIAHAAIAEQFLAGCLGGRAAPLEAADFSGSSVEVRAGLRYIPHLASVLPARSGEQ